MFCTQRSAGTRAAAARRAAGRALCSSRSTQRPTSWRVAKGECRVASSQSPRNVSAPSAGCRRTCVDCDRPRSWRCNRRAVGSAHATNPRMRGSPAALRQQAARSRPRVDGLNAGGKKRLRDPTWRLAAAELVQREIARQRGDLRAHGETAHRRRAPHVAIAHHGARARHGIKPYPTCGLTLDGVVGPARICREPSAHVAVRVVVECVLTISQGFFGDVVQLAGPPCRVRA
jgi:hypothetical protein